MFVVAMAFSSAATQPWDDPAVNSDNRLPARTYLPRKGFVQSLNGTWSFAWEGSADGYIRASPRFHFHAKFFSPSPLTQYILVPKFPALSGRAGKIWFWWCGGWGDGLA